MNPLTAALEYTPFLQLFLLYIYFYYKDLGRFLHPKLKKERNALSEWHDVLVDLQLISPLPKSERERLSSSGKKFFYFFIPPLLLSYITDLLLYEGIPAWYMAVIFQTVSALLLLIALSYTYFGPMASYGSMHSTRLSKNKIGSRITVMGEQDEEEKKKK